MYRDIEDIIREFWTASLTGDWDDFDFEEAFEEYERPLRYNLAQHGLMGWEEYRDFLESVYGQNIIPDELTLQSDWIYIGKAEVMDAVAMLHAKRLREAFKSTHEHLYDLWERIQERKGNTLRENIALFDECIHAQHVTGYILDDVDVEALREEVEEEWEEMQDFPTEMRAFL